MQDHVVPQVMRHPPGQELRAADESPHLGAVSRAEVALERPLVVLVAGGGDVEDREQERELARLGAEDRAGGGRYQATKALIARVAAVIPQPGLERLPVPIR